MYRPNDWDVVGIASKAYREQWGREVTDICDEYKMLIEAGADAMLEGLADLVGDDGYITFEKKDGKVIGVYIDD